MAMPPTHMFGPLSERLNAQNSRAAWETGGRVHLYDISAIAELLDGIDLNETEKVIERGRAILPELREQHWHGAPSGVLPTHIQVIADHVERELLRLCEVLATHGIDARPYRGWGVIFGDEILTGSLWFDQPAQLADALGVPHADADA